MIKIAVEHNIRHSKKIILWVTNFVIRLIGTWEVLKNYVPCTSLQLFGHTIAVLTNRDHANHLHIHVIDDIQLFNLGDQNRSVYWIFVFNIKKYCCKNTDIVIYAVKEQHANILHLASQASRTKTICNFVSIFWV